MSDDDLDLDVERELEAKLGDWRHSEGYKVVVEEKDVEKKRRKRKRTRSKSVTEEAVLAEPKESTKTAAELLSATLLEPRTDANWSEPVHIGVASGGIRKQKRDKSKKASGAKEEEYTDAAQLVERHRYEVGALGAGGLRKREKRAYDESTLKRLGFRDARRPKMPLTILEGRRRAEKARKIEAREKKREEGVLLKAKRKGR